MTTQVITGSTGHLGGRIARRLSHAGKPQRLMVRDVVRAPTLNRAEPVQAEYGDPVAVRAALAGADTVLMISASETADRVAQHRNFVDRAADAGVGHLIYVSFYRASPAATFTLVRDHAATEQHIRESGLQFTFLRDNLYADFLASMVGVDGVIRGPADAGRVSVVAQDDIADAAVAVLADPAAHAGATYELTGPEAMTFAQIAETIATATGTPVTYYAETVDEAFESRASYGASPAQLDAWVSTYRAIAAGELDGVSDDIPRLTGHPATSLADLLAR